MESLVYCGLYEFYPSQFVRKSGATILKFPLWILRLTEPVPGWPASAWNYKGHLIAFTSAAGAMNMLKSHPGSIGMRMQIKNRAVARRFAARLTDSDSPWLWLNPNPKGAGGMLLTAEEISGELQESGKK